MNKKNVVPGFMGRHLDIAHTNLSFAQDDTPDKNSHGTKFNNDIDLVVIARRCQNYLAHNPVRKPDWQCRFSFWGLHLPVFDPWPYCTDRKLKLPNIGLVDPITAGDTDSRMDYAYVYMREMAGSYPEVQQAEDGVRARIISYIDQDGLSWIKGPIAICDCDEKTPPAAVLWTTAKALLTQSELFRFSGDEKYKVLAKKLFHGLKSLASWETGRAYHKGGVWTKGEWKGAPWYQYILEPVIRYWETTGDQEAFEFVCAYADGIIANLPNLDEKPLIGEKGKSAFPGGGINPDGSFTAHVHCTLHAVSGLAHLGAITKEPRYIEWIRRVYEFIRKEGTDYGWFPEVVNAWCPDTAVHRRHTEICLVADMVYTAVWLGEAGYPEYFDQAERYVKNMLRESQFFVTPELESLYRKIHSDKPGKKVEEELMFLRQIEGGFVSSATPNDWVDENLKHHGTAGNPPLLLDMMGCCPPEGMRAIWTVWNHTVTSCKDGVYINMAFSGKHPEAEIKTYGSESGRFTIKAGLNNNYFLRPPAWTLRSKVQVYHNSKKIRPVWKDDYIQVKNAHREDLISLYYPVVNFIQEIDLNAGYNSALYRIKWQGNTVKEIHPKGKYLPLF